MSTSRKLAATLSLVLLLAHLTIGLAKAADAGAEAVAMITDVQGKVTFAADGVELSILARVPDQSQVELSAASRLVAVWLRSGEEFAFTGPAAIRITAGGPQMLAGAQPARRPSALENGKDIRIRAAGVTQAAVVMRSAGKNLRIRLLTLAGTSTLDVQPEFRWQPIPGVRQYRFELADATGRAVHELDVSGDWYRLPTAIKLDEDSRYTWEISARLPDGRKYAASADFMVMPAAQRERVESIRPSADASLAERVAFAAWLEEQELRDEARKYWKDAATERPQDAKLRQLAGE